jgi:hypothetical protein
METGDAHAGVKSGVIGSNSSVANQIQRRKARAERRDQGRKTLVDDPAPDVGRYAG